mmetsp:Transcript_18846/g.18514  ORF Transcript_18846/g.18514 Transcript_18846/m.18514 type:complete len:384 (-) Transcript_18846:24-1175(-)
MFRKKAINGFKKLKYLDDRPVTELERIASEAWCTGGHELEMQKRKEYQEADLAKKRTYYCRNMELQEEYKKYKAIKIENMKKDTREKRDKLMEKKDKLREMIRKARPHTEEKKKMEYEMENLDTELNHDMFDILKDDNIAVPPMRRVADQRNQPEELIRREQSRREQLEEEAKERARQEYLDRERPDLPKAPGLIPTPVAEQPRVKSKAERMRDEGVVMSTDSESENDPTLPAKRAGYRREIFKWDEFYENKLEEILIQHMFDFTKAAHEFSSMVNNFEDDSPENRFYYEINPKILQMKWTDVEIKKYRIVEFTKDKEDQEEDSEEDLPPLDAFEDDDPVRTYSQEPAEKPAEKKPQTNLFHQFSSSDSEEDDQEGTNFEELD